MRVITQCSIGIIIELRIILISGGGTVWAMWASGPPTFLTVWAWPTHVWHYFLLFLFCLSPLIVDFFQDWPTHFQNRSAAADSNDGNFGPGVHKLASQRVI